MREQAHDIVTEVLATTVRAAMWIASLLAACAALVAVLTVRTDVRSG